MLFIEHALRTAIFTCLRLGRPADWGGEAGCTGNADERVNTFARVGRECTYAAQAVYMRIQRPVARGTS